MAIAGLNPHSGEHGLFGWEEVEEIMPAIEELKAEGYDVAGPIGADSVFHQAAQGKYTSVLSLYHDQGHIATKTLDFEKRLRSQMVCRSFGHLWITEPHSILREKEL